jgi:hypothetical protein
VSDEKQHLPIEFRANTRMFADGVMDENSLECITILALLDDLDAADDELKRLSDGIDAVLVRNALETQRLTDENKRLKRWLRCVLDGDAVPADFDASILDSEDDEGDDD